MPLRRPLLVCARGGGAAKSVDVSRQTAAWHGHSLLLSVSLFIFQTCDLCTLAAFETSRIHPAVVSECSSHLTMSGDRGGCCGGGAARALQEGEEEEGELWDWSTGRIPDEGMKRIHEESAVAVLNNAHGDGGAFVGGEWVGVRVERSVWLVSTAQAADGPRLAEARGSASRPSQPRS